MGCVAGIKGDSAGTDPGQGRSGSFYRSETCQADDGIRALPESFPILSIRDEIFFPSSRWNSTSFMDSRQQAVCGGHS